MPTHDYVLNNASGAAFRSDLNFALSAIVSNNSSSSAPSTTYAYQWWADTSAGILKMRNSANNAWIDMLNLDGSFVFDLEDGSASAPSLRFATDTNTGLFLASADVIGISTGGTQRLFIDDTGHVGIGGNNTSNNRLHVEESSTEAFVDLSDVIFRLTNSNTSADNLQTAIGFTTSTTGVGSDSAIVSQSLSAGNSQLKFFVDVSNGLNLRGKVDGTDGVTGVETERFYQAMLGASSDGTKKTISNGFDSPCIIITANNDLVRHGFMTHSRHRAFNLVGFWYGNSGNSSGTTWTATFSVNYASTNQGYLTNSTSFTQTIGSFSNGQMDFINVTSSFPSMSANQFVNLRITFAENINGTALLYNGLIVRETTAP